MSSKIWVIKTTLPESMGEEEISSFSHKLIEAGAACIQHHKVTSTYKWEDEMKSESEWSIEIKVSRKPSLRCPSNNHEEVANKR